MFTVEKAGAFTLNEKVDEQNWPGKYFYGAV